MRGAAAMGIGGGRGARGGRVQGGAAQAPDPLLPPAAHAQMHSRPCRGTPPAAGWRQRPSAGSRSHSWRPSPSRASAALPPARRARGRGCRSASGAGGGGGRRRPAARPRPGAQPNTTRAPSRDCPPPVAGVAPPPPAHQARLEARVPAEAAARLPRQGAGAVGVGAGAARVSQDRRVHGQDVAGGRMGHERGQGGPGARGSYWEAALVAPGVRGCVRASRARSRRHRAHAGRARAARRRRRCPPTTS
jgi:hypothetical protein